MTSIPSTIEASLGSRVDLASRLRPSDNRAGSQRSAAPEGARSQGQAVASFKPPELPPPPNRAVTFRLTEDAERFYIEVVDRSTGEVIRQIPPAQLLELAEQVGKILNVSA